MVNKKAPQIGGAKVGKKCPRDWFVLIQMALQIFNRQIIRSSIILMTAYVRSASPPPRPASIDASIDIFAWRLLARHALRIQEVLARGHGRKELHRDRRAVLGPVKGYVNVAIRALLHIVW